MPIKRIVRITGLSRGLVHRVLRGEREDVFRLRQNSLTPWFPDLERYWQDGCRNGAELWRRLCADGFQGSLRVVGEWATRQRRTEAAIPTGSGKCPPSRQIARMMTTGRHHLSKSDSILVTQVEHALPALSQARRLLDAFTTMVRNGDAAAMAGWLEEASGSEMAAFARGLTADLDAVMAALREPWSNGQTEGQINRLKMLKTANVWGRRHRPAACASPTFSMTTPHKLSRRPILTPLMRFAPGPEPTEGISGGGGSGPGHARFLKRQDSLPVSMISQ
ncbi:transposase [Paracoccus yeei]|uniref:transposase n=1 Tax=Paracoccus yeei TaxID=147645 RepID=UPI0028D7051A|nr:hypothetical protein [Paracoccus yeei]